MQRVLENQHIRIAGYAVNKVETLCGKKVFGKDTISYVLATQLRSINPEYTACDECMEIGEDIKSRVTLQPPEKAFIPRAIDVISIASMPRVEYNKEAGETRRELMRNKYNPKQYLTGL